METTVIEIVGGVTRPVDAREILPERWRDDDGMCRWLAANGWYHDCIDNTCMCRAEIVGAGAVDIWRHEKSEAGFVLLWPRTPEKIPEDPGFNSDGNDAIVYWLPNRHDKAAIARLQSEIAAAVLRLSVN